MRTGKEVFNGAMLRDAVDHTPFWLCLLLFVIGLFFSAIIPPFQSPDEIDHIKRAYFLTQGRIILDTPAGSSSGGMLDTGLATYSAAYSVLPFKPERKLSAEEMRAASKVRWSGRQAFSPAPGTGYYFPLIYLPQAIGLAIGKQLDLTVERSYNLARLLALASISALLLVAFNLYLPNPLTIALLIMPMSLFQFASASLDGVSTALAVFAVAAFLRLDEKKGSNPRLFYAFVVTLALVTASRVHLLPLWALAFILCFRLESRKFFFTTAVAVLLVVSWLAFAIATTVDTRQVVGTSTINVVLFYLRHPLTFLDVLATTLSTTELVVFYRDSFIGVLGWLDTRFSENTYFHLGLCIALIGLLSLPIGGSRQDWIARGSLVSTAALSILLVFFALLITWNPHPAQVIQGVQGRYFLVPALAISYSLSNRTQPFLGPARRTALGLVFLLAAFSIFGTARLLIDRYYRAPAQPVQAASPLRPSLPLTHERPIVLRGIGEQRSDRQPLARIGILFGTYARSNPGKAELRLTAPEGQPLKLQFDLPDLADNRYRFFDLDPATYSSGEIAAVTGGGVSTWEVHGGSGVANSVATCLVLVYTNGAESYTPGCPEP